MGAVRLIAHLALLALVGVLATGCRGSTPGSDIATPAGTTAAVSWVNDGDTLTVAGGAKVRLVQIDAPELETDCWGRPALEALIALTPKGTRVRLVRDPGLDDRDRYGRLLRYVFAGGMNVNVALVRAGAASPYFFRNERGRYADELLRAVDEARSARRGYWGACPAAKLSPGVGSVTGPR